MPDPRSVMQEFRTLDAKRLAKGLSPEEERRLGELRELVGDEASAGTPRGGGFDVNAAAARLRESLLPAGLRNRPPPQPELSPEPEPEPFFPPPAPATAPAALDDAPAAEPEAPLFADADTAALFDPASLGWETEPAAPLPPFDPAGQQTAGWDASGGWDPNAASAQGWDPNAAGAQAWDPSAANAGWDPSAWDPAAAPVDAGGQPWDAGASPVEPDAQPWDPGALSADPNGQPWDPNAVAWEPGSAGGDPAAAGAWDPNPAPALDPGAPLFDFDPATLGADPAGGHAAYPDTGHGQPAVAEGAWAPSLLEAQDAAPADAAGQPLDAAWDPGFAAELELEPTRALALGAGVPDTTPGELPAADDDLAGTASPLDLDAGAFELEPIDDAALVQEDGGASLALAAEPAAAEWTVPALDAAIPDGFAFDDTAAAPEPTEMLGLASEPEPTQALPLLATDPAPLPPAGWDPVPAPAIAEPGAAFGDYDELAAGGVQLAQGDGLESGLDASLAGDPSAPLGAPGAGVLGEYDDTAGFAPGAVFEPPPDGGFEAGPPLALGDGASSALDGAAGWPVDGALDPSFELASGGSFDAGADAAAWTTAEAPAPWETAPVDAALEPLSFDLPAFASEPGPVTESHSLAPALPEPAASGEDDLALPEIVEEIPTIDGEEILEEIPADEAGFSPPLDFAATSLAPAPRPPPAAPPAAPAFVPASLPPPAAAAPAASPCVAPALPATTAVGVHRVVVHTLEGTVKRGVLEDADLSAPTLALAPGPGEQAEPIAAEKVKAIFFMLAPGEAPPAAEGKKVRVTFRDGRQVAGYSPGYREDGAGFFMIPADTRTNTGRIWVYRAAVKQVAVS